MRRAAGRTTATRPRGVGSLRHGGQASRPRPRVEQQRVAIARALASQPEALLADEPTSNLDAESSRTLLAIFQELQAEGKTIVLSSHDPTLIALSTQLYELHGGKLK
jgi:ABC-type lipoprotein export system ATPase subunit